MAGDAPPAMLESMRDPDTGWHLEATYADLPAEFYDRQLPVPVRDPQMVWVNEPWANDLGLLVPPLTCSTGAAWFTNGPLPPGAVPLAQAYAGHQFGGFNVLGDGRALLLGEQIAPDGRRWDIHLKGSGPTRYARRGDGRAALGPMLREVLISEAMHALGIPTTRSLAVVATGEPVWRQEGPLPGAVLVRTAASHLRVGTLQLAGALDSPNLLEALVTYAVARHVPPDQRTDRPALDLLDHLIEVQTSLVAAWMAVGFVHGVMNTDNTTLSGETIDYGPCAFVDGYDHGTVFSSIDRQGRYAYANQPRIIHWNIARAAEALLPLLATDQEQALAVARDRLDRVPIRYAAHHLATFRRRLGLTTEAEDDADLVAAWTAELHAHTTDLPLAWLDLLRLARGQAPQVLTGPAWEAWLLRWRARRPDPDLLAAATPRISPRNHRVEEALTAAVTGDWEPWNRLLAALQRPYEDLAEHADLNHPPAPEVAACHRTFCGT